MDITVVDLTEDKPLGYSDLLSRYTTIPSSSCYSIKGASDDGDIKGLSDTVSDKTCPPPETETPPTNMTDRSPAEPDKNTQITPRKSGIKLRLNPPKPKILLRVKQSRSHLRTIVAQLERIIN